MLEQTLQPFELVINGENVLPETVDIVALAPFLKAFRELLDGVAQLQEREDRNLFVCLTHTETGSNRVGMKCNKSSWTAMKTLSGYLTRNEQNRLPKKAIKNLGVMNRVLEEYGWDSCELRGGSLPQTILAVHQSKRSTYTGLTTIYGRFFKVGGLSYQTAQLRVDGKSITVHLKDQDMAVTLAPRLHQTIGLEGQATWFVDTDEIKEFRAETISPFHDRTPDGEFTDLFDSLSELRKLSKGRWNSVNPEQFIAEQRGDD